MKGECVMLDTDSPPPRPSAWQMRFGKRSSTQSHEQPTVEKVEADISSLSVSEQLFRALNTKPREKDLLSRECAEILIGRRNAFASEPELRLQVQDNDPDCLDTVEGTFDRVAMVAEAKEIIRLRLQIESQTDTLRQAPRLFEQPKRQHEVRGVKQKQSKALTTMFSNVGQTARLSRTSSQRNKDLHGRVQQTNNQKPEEMATREPPHRLNSRSANSKVSNKTTRPWNLPRHKLPMERRHELLNQARKARKLKAAEDKELLRMTMRNNNDGNHKQRRVEEDIQRLTLENQQAVALEERLKSRKACLEILNNCFGEWHQYTTHRHLQKAQVVAMFNWRTLKCFMARWRRYTYQQCQMRAAEQTRLALVHEEQMKERAKQFYRSKYLPNWFYRWVAFMAEQKEKRIVESDVGRRRVQAERLMERLLTKKIYKEHDPDEASGSRDSGAVVSPKQRPPAPTTTNESTYRDHSTCSTMNDSLTMACSPQQRMDAWSHIDKVDKEEISPMDAQRCADTVATSESQLSSKTTWAVKRVDPRYLAMEQRANERKLRREELKRKYEQVEARKQKQQEEERAAREAYLLHQKMEEKARIRERKEAEARALKEKQDRRDYLIAQRCEAKMHNRRRLLFYYAMLPWKRHYELNERVERNACRWHELRMIHWHWERWQKFVKICRKLRQRRERVLLQAAAKHYKNVLQRRVLQGWICQHQLTEARALAVRRQNQWNVLYRSWERWQKCVALERAHQQKRAVEATFMLEQMQLRRILSQWKRVADESKAQQELDREKQLMWRKIRGWLNEDA